MKKILSILFVLTMLVSCFSIGASAAAAVNVEGVATKSGDKIILTLSSDVDLKILQIAIAYDSSVVTFDGTSNATLADSNFVVNSSATDEYTGAFTYGVALETASGTAMNSNIVEFSFTPVAGTKIVANPFSISTDNSINLVKRQGGMSATMVSESGAKTIAKGTAAATFNADAIIEGGSTVVDEEEFETVTTAPTAGEYADFSSIALGTGATQLAVFGKNASAGLAAYDYGIVVGGVEFPGIADVDAGKYWCIKLVAPEGKDATGKAFLGNYKVKSYIITAEGTKYGDEVTVNVQ